MSEPKNIIYGLTDPRDGSLRYVGQSCKGMKRPQKHNLKNALRWNTHKINWIKQLKSLGLEYGIVLIEEVAFPDDLNAREIWWIAFARAWGVSLTNATSGGEGVRGLHFSAVSLAKMSAAQKGRKHTPETRAKIGAGSRGKIRSEATKELLRNRVITPEWREKMRETHRRNPQFAERLRRLNESRRGQHMSEETRAKMSVSSRHPRAPYSAEARAHMSAGAMGRVISEATRAKISAFWANRRHVAKILSA